MALMSPNINMKTSTGGGIWKDLEKLYQENPYF